MWSILQSVGKRIYCIYCITICPSVSACSDESRDMDGRPSWMRSLSTTAAQWLSVVPEVFCLFILV